MSLLEGFLATFLLQLVIYFLVKLQNVVHNVRGFV